MGVIGADPEALRELSRRFRKLHAQLEASRSEIDRHLRNAEWHGYDADRFRRTWTHQHRANLLRTAELCHSSTAALARNAEEQVRASEALGSGASLGSGRSTDNRSGNGRPGGGRPGGDLDIPSSITELRAGAAVTVASVLIGTSHDIRIEKLGDGTSRVTFTQVESAGLKGTVGAQISVKGQRAIGGGASAEASLGRVNRRTFVVDSADVWEVIAVVELGDAAQRVSHSVNPPGIDAVGAVASIGGWLSRHIPDPVKRAGGAIVNKFRRSPSAEENLVQVDVAADASASGVPILGPFASLFAGFTVRSGRNSGPSGSSTVFEVDGYAAADVHARLIGETEKSVGNQNDNPTVPTLRVEIPDPPGDDGATQRPIVITSTTTEGTTVRQSTTYLDTSQLLDVDLIARTKVVVERLAAGDVNAAIQELTSFEVPQEAVDTTTTTFRAADYSGGIETEAGEVVSVGADLDGGVQRFWRVN